jgi:hypothetical protein
VTARRAVFRSGPRIGKRWREAGFEITGIGRYSGLFDRRGLGAVSAQRKRIKDAPPVAAKLRDCSYPIINMTGNGN